MATGFDVLGAWIVQSSVALLLTTTMAALWCACAPRSSARVRHAVWLGALLLAPASPAFAHVRVTLLGTALDARGGALVLLPLSSAVVGVWSVGVVLLLARLVSQHVALWRWARGLAPDHRVSGAELSGRPVARRRDSRVVTVMRGEAGAMPVCWGILRPRIMLPADATRWSDDMTRIVLRHELAHIDRHDALGDLVARLAVGVLWFHPAAWLVSTRICVERERACDERVVCSGVDPVRYADHLLTLARATRPAQFAAAVARRGTLEERIAGLLAADGRRQPRGHWLPVVLALLLVALPAALLTPPSPHHRAALGIAREMASSGRLPGSHPGSFRASLLGGVR